MIYAEILAAGKGTRMGNVNLPKQFLSLQNRPIVVHTLEKFLVHDRFDKILVMVPRDWMNHAQDVIRRHIGTDERVVVVEGGEDRNGTIMRGVQYIEENYGVRDDDIVVTHDSVRPFVTHRIIEENIEYALRFGAVDTAVPATDTIIQSEDGRVITDIPLRSEMFQGQTPQSFNIKKLVSLYQKLTNEQRRMLTDACKIVSLSGEPVHIVRGEVFNIKITTPYDLRVAEAMCEEKEPV
ncbi:IspD/TarI family cytidylyltransferase [Alicyclobacillus shizuokensis]|uniref:IspD/TarI family cytidylyltransferase n=1 Tax=Alicyclobacillus shizuokensis TaxID=392014 RepID=UPI000830A843|nr:2-C-methyl-D-erythritol 4-phosphate cytidylyltransferase [Alicyclobacillus shizuokensis]